LWISFCGRGAPEPKQEILQFLEKIPTILAVAYSIAYEMSRWIWHL